MNIQTLLPYLVVAVVVILAALGIMYAITRIKSQQLRKKFGPEYDYTLQKEGDPKKAEQSLVEREKRVTHLDIHPLDENARDRYNEEWMEIQAFFVDDPKKAVDQANRLITEVMIARGFPAADFEQRAADLSVLYPEFVPNYRNAYAIAMKNQEDGSSTEELRQAMVYYHSLFGELLGPVQIKEKELETA